MLPLKTCRELLDHGDQPSDAATASIRDQLASLAAAIVVSYEESLVQQKVKKRSSVETRDGLRTTGPAEGG